MFIIQGIVSIINTYLLQYPHYLSMYDNCDNRDYFVHDNRFLLFSISPNSTTDGLLDLKGSLLWILSDVLHASHGIANCSFFQNLRVLIIQGTCKYFYVLLNFAILLSGKKNNCTKLANFCTQKLPNLQYYILAWLRDKTSHRVYDLIQ